MTLGIARRRLLRSWWGDLLLYLLLAAIAAFTAMPLVFAVSQAFMPFDEMFRFPPRFIVRHPTLDNIRSLMLLMARSWVPISRYFFNSVIMVVLGVVGNILVTSLAAYPLAKHQFPGRSLFNTLVVASLMIATTVTQIPNYLTLARLGLIDTYWAIIVPTWNYTLGLYLMIKFMESMVSDQLLAAARIDGASEFRVYATIVMPIIRPAWLTSAILVLVSQWKETGGKFIYSEKLKTLPFALTQLSGGGWAWWGPAAVVTVILAAVPVVFFTFAQASIVETMSTSGMSTSGEE